MARLKNGINDLYSYCINNDLQYLLEEWDYQNNHGKTPSDYSFGSKQEMFWICRCCGSSFPARINTRVRYRTRNCSDCAKKQSWNTRHEKLIRKNNLATEFPEIAAEWDYELNNGITPEDVTKGTRDVYYWKCPNGHPSYPARVANRAINGTGCPVCSGRKLLAGINDLATVNPRLASQWDYERNYPKTPQEVFPHEGNKYWWICPICGESYLAKVSDRAKGTAHAKCTKKGSSFPEQAIFYYVSKCFSDAVSRDTSFGFELDVFIPSIGVAVEYDGVKYHEGQEKLEKDNRKDALCKNADVKLFRFRDPVLPDTISAKRITCPDNRESVGEGIRELLAQLSPESKIAVDPQNDYYEILDNALLVQKEKSIVVTHQEIAAEWHPTKNLPLTPEKVTSGMGIDIWWVCSACGKPYLAKMYSRKAGRGCPDCGRKSSAKNRSLTAAKKNSFLLQYPELAKEISLEDNPGLDISKLAAGSAGVIIWRCRKCGKPFRASIKHRVEGTGCPVCGRERTRKAAERAVINLDTGERFESLTKAAESVGGDKRNIHACCSGKTKKAYGYHWQYADDKTRKRPIGMLIHNIETDELFSSIQEAANKYGCSRTSILSALNGKAKTSMGYHWEFVEKT